MSSSSSHLLKLTHEVELLKDGNADLRIKASNQELIIDRMKSDALRAKMEAEGRDARIKKLETMIQEYHRKEVTLTAERDTYKRELEVLNTAHKRELDLMNESVKKVNTENTTLKGVIECERNKKQKMRRSYATLKKSFNGADEGEDIRLAMEQLHDGLMN